MKDRLYYIGLYDYYSGLFTEIQQSYFEEYYFNNLSLTEIADNYKVSKNAISKTLKEVTTKLDYYENSLKLQNNKNQIIKIINDDKIISKIEDYI